MVALTRVRSKAPNAHVRAVRVPGIDGAVEGFLSPLAEYCASIAWSLSQRVARTLPEPRRYTQPAVKDIAAG